MSLTPGNSPQNEQPFKKDIFPDDLKLPSSYSERQLCDALQEHIPGAITLLRVKMQLYMSELMDAFLFQTGKSIDEREFVALIGGDRIVTPSLVNDFAAALGVETRNIYQLALAIRRNSTLSGDEVGEELQQAFDELMSRPDSEDPPEDS